MQKVFVQERNPEQDWNERWGLNTDSVIVQATERLRWDCSDKRDSTSKDLKEGANRNSGRRSLGAKTEGWIETGCK